VQALFLGATAVGGLIGGWAGDRAAMHYANHGRIFVVQFSVSMGPLFSVLLLKARHVVGLGCLCMLQPVHLPCCTLLACIACLSLPLTLLNKAAAD